MGKLIYFDDLKSLKGITFSPSHLRRLEDAKKFPQRVQVGERRIAWDEDEIDQWVEQKKTAREAGLPRRDFRRRVRRPAAAPAR